MNMSLPEITNLNYTYKKPDTEVWVLNTDDIPVNKELIKDQQIAHLAPQSVGGNHMHPDGQIKLITVPSFLAHAVVNRSQGKVGILFEMADGKMKEVGQVKVV